MTTREAGLKLHCPRCEAPVSRARALLPARRDTFTCRGCGANLALDGNGRTLLLATLAGSLFVSGLARARFESLLPALAVLAAGLVLGGLLTWRFGTLFVRQISE